MCSLGNITLRTRTTKADAKGKSYKYTEYVCTDCGATQQWGAYQDGSGFFLKQWKPRFDNTSQDAVNAPERANKPSGGVEGSPDLDMVDEGYKMLNEMYPEGDMSQNVFGYTAFIGKNEETIGKHTLEELSEKWLASTYKKIKSDYQGYKKTQGIIND